MIRVALLALLLLLAGCGDDAEEKADDEPEVVSRELPRNLCDWVPREYLTGLVVNEPTNSEALGTPTSICTAVSARDAGESRYVNVILKRFDSLDQARADNAKACLTFAELAPEEIEAPGVEAVATCARRGETSTYVITVPNESGDALLVAVGGTQGGAGLTAAVEITSNITRQLG